MDMCNALVLMGGLGWVTSTKGTALLTSGGRAVVEQDIVTVLIPPGMSTDRPCSEHLTAVISFS